MSESFETSNTEPVIVFRDDKELKSCLKEWQRVLYLEDWIIQALLIDHDTLQVITCGEDLKGRNEFDIVNKCAKIYIVREDEGVSSRLVRYCAEHTLVHELLHCKMSWLDPPDTAEGKYFDNKEHQLLEEMARSLIMVKYNITKEWFSNIG